MKHIEFDVCEDHADEAASGCPWCEIEGLEIDLDNAEEARDDAIEDAQAEFADDADCAEAAEQVWAALREGKPFEPDVWPFDELRFRLRQADRRAL